MAQTFPSTAEQATQPSPSPKDLLATGKQLRNRVPRASHAHWKPSDSRPNPIDLLHAADANRLPNLVPVRYERMLVSPFTFYRGTAGVMAADLAKTPVIDVFVQACGDCHLMNFGGFATPERAIVFDINDFDETLPAPWEWDVKRLATSFVLAARNNGLSDDVARVSSVACVRSYRSAMRDYSRMSPLELWYYRFGKKEFFRNIPDPKIQQLVEERIEKAMAKSGSVTAYAKLAEAAGGEIRIRENPPLIYHPEDTRRSEVRDFVQTVMNEYRQTLPEDRRVLLDRYKFVDAALKVVGVGSVGTRCWAVLMMSASNNPLLLQIKQANASVLEPYAGKSVYPHNGQRVVMGQRLMQAASDIFLGWTTGRECDYYVRQLRDAKISPLVESYDDVVLVLYAKVCGANLARAHAKGGDPWTISGYLGKSDEFDEAIGDFAMSYANQTAKDYAAFKSQGTNATR